MKLIVGLGNTGSRYARTRHNLGFMVIDELARQLAAPAWTADAQAPALSTSLGAGEERIVLVKPQTMMNLSGQAVGALARYYRIDPADIWVIHDELDLPFGSLRVRLGGSSAGHNGLKSIIEAVGEDFGRWRLGIANSQLRDPVSGHDFVLQAFDAEEQASLEDLCAKAATLVSQNLNQNLMSADYDLMA